MPPLARAFGRGVGDALGIARAGELARDQAPPGSLARAELRPSRLEALYEMAYLRTFVAWEVFLEDSFLRMMCGFESARWIPVRPVGVQRSRTLRQAQVGLYAGRGFILWHNPNTVIQRAQQWFDNGPHETVIGSQLANLEWMAAVRHRVAHGSEDVRNQFDIASMQFAGRRYPASSAGRFLRDWNGTTRPPERWLETLGLSLVGLAQQISP